MARDNVEHIETGRKESHDRTEYKHTLRVTKDNWELAVNAGESWVRNHHRGEAEDIYAEEYNKVGETDKKRLGILPSSRKKEIYIVKVRATVPKDRPSKGSQPERRRRRKGERVREDSPRRRIRAFTGNTRARFQEKIRRQSYYRNRAIFKAKLTSQNQVSIPNLDMEITDIMEYNNYSGALWSPYLSEPIDMPDLRVSTNGITTIRKEFFEGSNRGRQGISWAQFIISDDSGDPVREMKTMLDISPGYYFDRMIFKRRIQRISDTSKSPTVTIRNSERRQLNINPGDEMKVTMVALEGGPAREIKSNMAFNTEVKDHGSSLGFSISDAHPWQRWGWEPGAAVQVIAYRI